MFNHYTSLVNQPVTEPILDTELSQQLKLQNLCGTLADYYTLCEPHRLIEIGMAHLSLHPIVEKYLHQMNIPKRINFLTGIREQTQDLAISQIEHEYWYYATNYHQIKKCCANCGAYCDPCDHCYLGVRNFDSSYTDSARTNFNAKYCYFRKQHFYECIVQFQGKQAMTIEPELLAKLHKMVKQSHKKLLTKKDIMKWLRDLNAIKHYENIHLIYSIITQTPCHNLEAFENKLLDDFDLFLTEYTKLINTRKNFINVQYVLFQFLMRYRFPCKQDDFLLPRTIEIKRIYDQITSQIFAKLEWNYTPIH